MRFLLYSTNSRFYIKSTSTSTSWNELRMETISTWIEIPMDTDHDEQGYREHFCTWILLGRYTQTLSLYIDVSNLCEYMLDTHMTCGSRVVVAQIVCPPLSHQGFKFKASCSPTCNKTRLEAGQLIWYFLCVQLKCLWYIKTSIALREFGCIARLWLSVWWTNLDKNN
jgi:hypothetical protein